MTMHLGHLAIHHAPHARYILRHPGGAGFGLGLLLIAIGLFLPSSDKTAGKKKG